MYVAANTSPPLSVSSQESTCDDQSPIPNDASFDSPTPCSPVINLKNNFNQQPLVYPQQNSNIQLQQQHKNNITPKIYNQTLFKSNQRQNHFNQYSQQNIHLQNQTASTIQQMQQPIFKKPRPINPHKNPNQSIIAHNVTPQPIRAHNTHQNFHQPIANHSQTNITQQWIQQGNHLHGVNNPPQNANLHHQIFSSKQGIMNPNIPQNMFSKLNTSNLKLKSQVVNQGHLTNQIQVNPVHNKNMLQTISNRFSVNKAVISSGGNMKKAPGQVLSYHRGKQTLHMTKNGNIAKKNPRVQQLIRTQLQRGIQNNLIKNNLQPVQQNQFTRMHQNIALNISQQNQPRNCVQPGPTIKFPIQKNQGNIPNNIFQGFFPQQKILGNIPQQHQPGNLPHHKSPGNLIQQFQLGNIPRQTPTQNQRQPLLQSLNRQVIQQQKHFIANKNTQQQDKMVLGIMKNANGQELFMQDEIERVREMRNTSKMSYRFECVSTNPTTTTYRKKYQLLLVYPHPYSEYTEYVSEIMLVIYHNIPPGVPCNYICPFCTHAVGCLCSVCKLENNRFHVLPKYKLNQVTQQSEEYQLVLKALEGTGRDNTSIYRHLEKVFKITSQFPGYPSNPKDSRLFYHGTSVESAMSILKTGFQILPTAASGRRFGNGCYFTPSFSTAAYYAANASRSGGIFTAVQYIFVCEIRKFRDLAQPVKLGGQFPNSGINHYHGRLTFDTDKDYQNPEGIPISYALKPRTIKALDSSLFADEIVVRNDEYIRPVYLARVLTIEYDNVRCRNCHN